MTVNPASQANRGTPDLVNKSLQTTRRFDALKMWLTLRTAGPDALGQMMDALMETARQLYARMQAYPELEVAQPPSLTTLVFRFQDNALGDKQLDYCNRGIRARLARSGRGMIAATRVSSRQFLKFTLLNPHTGIESLQALLDEIVTIGRQEAQAHASATQRSA